MSLVEVPCAARLAHVMPCTAIRRISFLRPNPGKTARQPLSTDGLPQNRKEEQAHRPRQPHKTRHRRLRCDCGQLAVTVLRLRVGSDPQYTIHMPLCPACLNLEQELHA